MTLSVFQTVVSRPDGGDISCFRMSGKSPGFLFAGGYGVESPVQSTAGLGLLQYCAARNQDCVLVEFRGQGQSSGNLHDNTLASMVSDLVAASEALGLADRIAVGASLGAWALLAAQREKPSLIRSLLALAPAINWDQTFIRPRLEIGKAVRSADGLIRLPAHGIVLSGDFLEKAEEARAAFADIAVKDAIRILHGDQDGIAPASESIRLVAELAPRCDTHIRLYKGVGHELSKLKGLPVQDLFRECDYLLKLAAGREA